MTGVVRDAGVGVRVRAGGGVGGGLSPAAVQGGVMVKSKRPVGLRARAAAKPGKKARMSKTQDLEDRLLGKRRVRSGAEDDATDPMTGRPGWDEKAPGYTVGKAAKMVTRAPARAGRDLKAATTMDAGGVFGGKNTPNQVGLAANKTATGPKRVGGQVAAGAAKASKGRVVRPFPPRRKVR